MDRLRGVLKETREISVYQLDKQDDYLDLLQENLKQARLDASYMLSQEDREKISRVESKFGMVSHEAGDGPTELASDQLEMEFEECSQEALESLPRAWENLRFNS